MDSSARSDCPASPVEVPDTTHTSVEPSPDAPLSGFTATAEVVYRSEGETVQQCIGKICENLRQVRACCNKLFLRWCLHGCGRLSPRCVRIRDLGRTCCRYHSQQAEQKATPVYLVRRFLKAPCLPIGIACSGRFPKMPVSKAAWGLFRGLPGPVSGADFH